MVSGRIILVSMVTLSIVLLLVNAFLYGSEYLGKLAATFMILAVTYFVFKMVLEDRLLKRLSDYKSRYYYSKALYISYLLVTSILLLIVWVDDIQALIVGFGLVAAAFTITMQDVARSFVGGLIIFFDRIYSVGDRIEIGDKQGDVIDISLLYTTVLEIGDWVDGDQPTGRLSAIPNSYILSNVVNNYTKDFNFIWDEMIIPVTYDSDWKEAVSLIMDAVRIVTGDLIDRAEKAIPVLKHKYYFSGRSTEPAVFIKLTDNWIECHARFVTDPWSRRIIRNSIGRKILEGIEKSDNVKIASRPSI
jgi:small-conductance mechanosensitive channel